MTCGMANVFLSYSSQDRERLRPLVREIELRGWTVWWDRDLIVGPSFADRIQKEIDAAECIVVAWSKHSVASNWCRDEANEGLQRHRLVPILIDDVRPPLGFRSSHTADLIGWPHREGDLEDFIVGVSDCLKIVSPASSIRRVPEPDEVSLLVLPFKNLSAEADQDHLCDGLVEDITSSLSHIPELVVLSRATAFEFRDSLNSAAVIANRLGAQSVLSGSMRRSGDRVRVSAHLERSCTGQTIWSQTYDREIEEAFELEDELTREIVTALDVELVHGEHSRLAGFQQHSADARRELYKGMFDLYRYEPTTMVSARQHFERFVELEPDSPLGYSWLAYVWAASMLAQWAAPEEAIPTIKANSAKALSIDPTNVSALLGDAYWRLFTGDLEAAWESANRAVDTAPNSDEALFTRGFIENFLGHTERSIASLERSLRLCPVPSSVRLGVMATAYRNAGRFEDSIAFWKRLISRFPNFLFGYSGLASTYAIAGQKEQAQEMIARVLQLDPDYSVSRFATPNFYRDKSVLENCVTALLEAGMPKGH